MTNAILFEDWLKEQGDDVRLVMCEGHPETLILVDTINFAVYRYVPAVSQDGAREAMEELMRARVQELGIEVPE